MMSWLTGQGFAPGSVVASGAQWLSRTGWAALVKVAEVLVRSRVFEWAVLPFRSEL